MGKGDGAHQLVNDHVNDKDQTLSLAIQISSKAESLLAFVW